MAGTDTSQPNPAPATLEPAIILVGSQLGENIGSVARAMLNCALTDLRLVRPRDGWPNPRAKITASGADLVLKRAQVFGTVQEAAADLHWVAATTARRRDMVKELLTPKATAAKMHRLAKEGARAGILFGPERIGLTNDEVSLADAVVTAPLNPGFSSLNLAQSVLLVVYEYFQAGLEEEPAERLERGSRQATREELHRFFGHLEGTLDAVGYFKTPDLRPTQVRSLRNLLHRAELTEQEVRSLHGVVTMLYGKRMDQIGK